MDARDTLLLLSIKYNGEWEKIYDAIKNKEDVGDETHTQMLQQKKDVMEKLKINYITVIDADYPSALKESPRPPFVIYYRGNKSVLDLPCVFTYAPVNDLTSFGQRVIIKAALEAQKAGQAIVGGTTSAGDEFIHKVTTYINHKGIVVLSAGIDVGCRLHNTVVNPIVLAGGCVVSTLPVGVAEQQYDSENFCNGLSRGQMTIAELGTTADYEDIRNKIGRATLGKIYAAVHDVTEEVQDLCNKLIADEIAKPYIGG